MLAERLKYNTIGSDTGIDGMFKIYFKSDISSLLSGADLPIINGVQLRYNASQKKLSLEKLKQ